MAPLEVGHVPLLDIFAGRNRIYRPLGDIGVAVERDQVVHVLRRVLAQHEPLGLETPTG